MTATQRLASIQIKIDRAKKHLDELREQLSAFRASAPYKVETKRDPGTRRLIYFVADVCDPPMALSVLVGEIFQCLRSALDHLAYQLVQIGTGGPGPFTYVYFPICGDAATYSTQKRKKTNGMRTSALAAIDTIKPYRGGNDVLWWLDKLNNIDKHRLLITVGSAYRSVNIAPSMAARMSSTFPPAAVKLLAGMKLFLSPEDRRCPLKVGDELFSDLPDAQPTNTQFCFEIAFNEPGICEGESIEEVANETIVEVERVANAFLSHLV